MAPVAQSVSAANLTDTVYRYRIHAVARFTGIKAPTLRAWERRYGLPQPGRSTGAYRLYSGRDVALVSRMRDLCAEGHSPAEAAKQVLGESSGAELKTPNGDAYDAVRQALLHAALSFDVDGAQRALRLGQTLGSSVELYERAIAPALQDIGTAWCEDRVSVAQEHLISDICETTLRNLLQLSQPISAPRLAVLCCMEHEPHTLPLFGVGLHFTSWGYRVVVLGSRLPPGDLERAVRALQPDVVGLSVTAAPPTPRVLRDYAHACGKRPWILGGGASKALARSVQSLGGIIAPGDLTDLRAMLAAHRPRGRKARAPRSAAPR